jgi:hypothetical protein
MSDMPRIGEEGFIGTTKAAKIEETLSLINSKDGEAPTIKLTPEQEYEEGLKKHNVTLAEARVIMEAMFVKGFYEEEIYLGANTYVTLRTRQYFDTIRSNRKLEADRVDYVTSINDIINRYNAAASLVKYGSKSFDVPNPLEDVAHDVIENCFTKRLDFLERLPAQICFKIMQKTFEFDQKMYAVMADGAPKDF